MARFSDITPTPNPFSWRVVWLFLAAIVAGVAFLDVAIAQQMQGLPAGLHMVMRWLTDLGDSSWSFALFGAIALACLIIGTFSDDDEVHFWRNASFFVLANLMVSGLSTVLLKMVIGRARPGTVGLGDHLAFAPFTHSSAWASFPSGHTTTAVALALSLGLALPRFRPVFLVAAALVAISRMALGVHWFSDTCAGGLVAYLSYCALAYRLPGLLAVPSQPKLGQVNRP
ncbi:phosphatase PAP2 family protein [Paracoccus sp. (in: a-proteobacteria)]|uniref:phosphatase PAP2 family protein n=1 Tax=Paracoccus sp. TaxID=267 RepID=UPI0028A164CC|nr:phosphatase PAP2 family protein [Paracoccus sp. (in: a-proteobacteria)]